MLVTSRRPKLPKFAAWPVTTGRLNNFAGDMSFLDGAEVYYSDYNVTWFVSHPQVRARPYGVLEIRFGRSWNPEGEWNVTVRAIPAERAPRVRALVNEELLPRMRQWLQATETPPPGSTRQRPAFLVFYGESDDRLHYEER